MPDEVVLVPVEVEVPLLDAEPPPGPVCEPESESTTQKCADCGDARKGK